MGTIPAVGVLSPVLYVLPKRLHFAVHSVYRGHTFPSLSHPRKRQPHLSMDEQQHSSGRTRRRMVSQQMLQIQPGRPDPFLPERVDSRDRRQLVQCATGGLSGRMGI